MTTERPKKRSRLSKEESPEYQVKTKITSQWWKLAKSASDAPFFYNAKSQKSEAHLPPNFDDCLRFARETMRFMAPESVFARSGPYREDFNERVGHNLPQGSRRLRNSDWWTIHVSSDTQQILATYDSSNVHTEFFWNDKTGETSWESPEQALSGVDVSRSIKQRRTDSFVSSYTTPLEKVLYKDCIAHILTFVNIDSLARVARLSHVYEPLATASFQLPRRVILPGRFMQLVYHGRSQHMTACNAAGEEWTEFLAAVPRVTCFLAPLDKWEIVANYPNPELLKHGRELAFFSWRVMRAIPASKDLVSLACEFPEPIGEFANFASQFPSLTVLRVELTYGKTLDIGLVDGFTCDPYGVQDDRRILSFDFLKKTPQMNKLEIGYPSGYSHLAKSIRMTGFESFHYAPNLEDLFLKLPPQSAEEFHDFVDQLKTTNISAFQVLFPPHALDFAKEIYDTIDYAGKLLPKLISVSLLTKWGRDRGAAERKFEDKIFHHVLHNTNFKIAELDCFQKVTPQLDFDEYPSVKIINANLGFFEVSKFRPLMSKFPNANELHLNHSYGGRAALRLTRDFDRTWLGNLHILSLRGADVFADFGGCTKLQYLKLEECTFPVDFDVLGRDLASLSHLDKLAIVDPVPCVPVEQFQKILKPLRLQFLRLDLNNFPRKVSRAEIEACLDVGRNPVVLCAKD